MVKHACLGREVIVAPYPQGESLMAPYHRRSEEPRAVRDGMAEVAKTLAKIDALRRETEASAVALQKQFEATDSVDALALAEQGRAHICGAMQTIEDQLCSFAPGTLCTVQLITGRSVSIGVDRALEYRRRSEAVPQSSRLDRTDGGLGWRMILSQ